MHDLSPKSMLGRCASKNAPQQTSQRVKRTSGARVMTDSCPRKNDGGSGRRKNDGGGGGHFFGLLVPSWVPEVIPRDEVIQLELGEDSLEFPR